MSQLWIPRGAQMYVMCLNVSHVSKLARYAREFQQCTASVKTLCHMCQISLATLASSSMRAWRANRRSLEQWNLMTKLRQKWQKWAMDGPFNRRITWQKLPKNDKNGNRTDPATGEFPVKSAEKWRKSAKTGKKPRNTSEHQKCGTHLTPVRRRTFIKLWRSLTKVHPRITIENRRKTHRATESTRDIILTKISPRFNRRLTRNVQGHGIVPKSEQ